LTPRAKKITSAVGRSVLSLGLLALLTYVFRNELGRSLEKIREALPLPLVLAATWYVIFIFVSAWRWQVLLRARGLHFSTWYLARVFTLGLFFCKLLPTSIGGDVMRIAYTAPRGRSAEAFSATFLDRLIGFVSLTSLAVTVAVVLYFSTPAWRGLSMTLGRVTLSGATVVLLLGAVLLLLVLGTLTLFNDAAHRSAVRLFGGVRFFNIGSMLDRAYGAVKQYRHDLGALAMSFVSGLGVQAALSFSWFHTAQAIGGAVPLVYYFVMIPLLNIIVNIPSIGGLGVREASFSAFYVFFSGPLDATQQPDAKATAIAVAMLFLALDLVFALAGGVLFAVTGRKTEVATRGKQPAEVAEKEDGSATSSQTEH
jgi:uncharacterized protein (TIRG00374 family)